ncbi:hypothetical protein [uncultured Arthrobacter sp.]|uniref:hypothetical protein n=1 Tax=uncultured Arthrobacter sp. TaxID=114050 RepID=UPI002611BF99|nr:hypothetical protein [uncultured Arthrobacter sp.]
MDDESGKRKQHEKAETKAAWVSSGIAGLAGGPLFAGLLTFAQSQCGPFGERQTDPWCGFVSTPGFRPDVGGLIIGVLVACIAFAVVYAWVYFTDEQNS